MTSSKERYGTRKDNRVVERLLEAGPLPRSDLPYAPGPTIRREVPMHRVNPSRSAQAGINVGGTTAVYYLRDAHPPELVARRFLEVNPHLLDFSEESIGRLLDDHAEELAAAWHEIASEYDTNE
jgi:hypothetical protein